MKQVHVYIKGDVIGVGFRAWTKIQAKMVGVSGWVRNVFEHPDKFGPGGGVEVVFQGEDDKVEEMVARVKDGPPVARVDDVETYFQHIKEVFEGFQIRK
jgi:acylphosphatase